MHDRAALGSGAVGRRLSRSRSDTWAWFLLLILLLSLSLALFCDSCLESKGANNNSR